MTEFGHDEDRTVMMQPKQAEAPAAKKRSPWLWVGLLGCAGLLCLGLVGGVVAFFALGGNGEDRSPGRDCHPESHAGCHADQGRHEGSCAN